MLCAAIKENLRVSTLIKKLIIITIKLAKPESERKPIEYELASADRSGQPIDVQDCAYKYSQLI